MTEELIINGNGLTLKDLREVVYNYKRVTLCKNAEKKIEKCREKVNSIVESDSVVYGITTGFGKFENIKIDKKDARKLQKNLILSHSVGVSEPLNESICRAMLLLRANALAKGFSGIRPIIIDQILFFLNNKITPCIPSRGSVGASGDLAPLSHMVLGLIGEGFVFFNGEKQLSSEVLKKLNREPLELQEKEGLALINGTQFMTAHGAISLLNAQTLLDNAILISALSTDCLKGSKMPFHPKVHQLRPHKGQIEIAKKMWDYLENSELNNSHKNCEKVQDRYSIRCIPQVAGAIYDTLEYAKKVIEIEMNSVTDNPLIFPDDDLVISAGNFHGEPIAFINDFLAIAISEMASISERRTESLVNPALSGLPAFLTPLSGLNSGLMIAQYVSAGLTSENKVLAHPGSVDSIPTSANQEDHVSMGSVSALKLPQILENTANVIAIELLCATQALEFLRPLKTSPTLEKLYSIVREIVLPLKEDRLLYPDINTLFKLTTSRAIMPENSLF